MDAMDAAKPKGKPRGKPFKPGTKETREAAKRAAAARWSRSSSARTPGTQIVDPEAKALDDAWLLAHPAPADVKRGPNGRYIGMASDWWNKSLEERAARSSSTRTPSSTPATSSTSSAGDPLREGRSENKSRGAQEFSRGDGMVAPLPSGDRVDRGDLAAGQVDDRVGPVRDLPAVGGEKDEVAKPAAKPVDRDQRAAVARERAEMDKEVLRRSVTAPSLRMRCNKCGAVVAAADRPEHAERCHVGYDETESRRWSLP